MATRAAWVPVLVVFGAIVRILPWIADYPLHHDEALYGHWARLILSGRDPLLLTAWVDKPPLVIYALAASLKLFGVSELALRVPGLLVSLATLICTYGFAARLYGPRVARWALWLLAASPFAILFAPTAFTDPWLTLFMVAAAWAAVAGRSFWAGLLLGLAVAAKQQGVLAAPLVIALLMMDAGRKTKDEGWQISDGVIRQSSFIIHQSSIIIRRFLAAALGFAVVFAPLTDWDSLRWATRPSFWDRSLTTYGGLALAPLALWPERAAAWAEQLGYLFGLPILSAVILGLAVFAGAAAWWSFRLKTFRVWTNILSLYLVGYLLLHFIITFQPWDRYLLPILPLICVLAAQGGLRLWRAAGRVRWLKVGRAVAGVVLLALLVGSAWLGMTARLPVGSDHGAYAGLGRIAATLAAQPADAVIYDRWLGWHFDFYLFDAPQTRRWWDSGWKLADDAAVTVAQTPDRPQWLVLPGWRDAAAGEIRLALHSRGLALSEVERVYRPDGSRAFTVYRIISAEVAHGR